MAIGDDASAAGYPLVADSDLVKDGAKELNRTRDFVAQVKNLLPVGSWGYRNAARIDYGWADPSGGSNGDIYFKLIG